jgi:hypothetical protein
MYCLDVKSSWDATTFPFFDTEIPTKDYYYQLQGIYVAHRKATVNALLLPCRYSYEMVEDEIRRAHWKLHKLDEDLGFA